MMHGVVRDGVESLLSRWCGLMHRNITWPRGGRYVCRVCGRHYPVPWDGDETGGFPAFESVRTRVLTANRSSERAVRLGPRPHETR
jgi:hypothetical protein